MKTLKWSLGVVSWFDDTSGKGVIEGTDGVSYFVHYSSIESEKKWKNLKSGQQVKFQIFPDPKLKQAHKVKEV